MLFFCTGGENKHNSPSLHPLSWPTRFGSPQKYLLILIPGHRRSTGHREDSEDWKRSTARGGVYLAWKRAKCCFFHFHVVFSVPPLWNFSKCFSISKTMMDHCGMDLAKLLLLDKLCSGKTRNQGKTHDVKMRGPNRSIPHCNLNCQRGCFLTRSLRLQVPASPCCTAAEFLQELWGELYLDIQDATMLSLTVDGSIEPRLTMRNEQIGYPQPWNKNQWGHVLSRWGQRCGESCQTICGRTPEASW